MFTCCWFPLLIPEDPGAEAHLALLTPPFQHLFSALSTSALTASHAICQLPEPTIACSSEPQGALPVSVGALHSAFLCAGLWVLSCRPPQEHSDLHFRAIISFGAITCRCSLSEHSPRLWLNFETAGSQSDLRLLSLEDGGDPFCPPQAGLLPHIL